MGIMIRPSATIRQNYNIISDLCRKTGEPVFLTKNGKGDLVVLNIDAYNEREHQIEIREKLVEVEELRLMGVRDIPADTMRERLEELMRDGRRKLWTGEKPHVQS